MILQQTPLEDGSTTERLARRAMLRAALGLGVAALAGPGQAFAKALIKDPKVLIKSPKIITKTPKLLASKTSRQISLLNLHTGEKLNAEYMQDGQYVKSAMHAISVLLRDHYNNKTHQIDPRLLDLAVALHRRFGSSQQFQVVCGYRSPETNAMMHEESSGVAVHSMHIEGKAIDLRLPGTRLGSLRKNAVAMKMGGVGFYPEDDFVHIDTGAVRRWVG
jgi:uncharacterized protein YcbK (DUF882 family)